jgi:hypothetical protein
MLPQLVIVGLFSDNSGAEFNSARTDFDFSYSKFVEHLETAHNFNSTLELFCFADYSRGGHIWFVNSSETLKASVWQQWQHGWTGHCVHFWIVERGPYTEAEQQMLARYEQFCEEQRKPGPPPRKRRKLQITSETASPTKKPDHRKVTRATDKKCKARRGDDVEEDGGETGEKDGQPAPDQEKPAPNQEKPAPNQEKPAPDQEVVVPNQEVNDPFKDADKVAGEEIIERTIIEEENVDGRQNMDEMMGQVDKRTRSVQEHFP